MVYPEPFCSECPSDLLFQGGEEDEQEASRGALT